MNGCREFSGYLDKNGYGQISRKTVWGTRKAHRVAFAEYYGYLPALVCHKCNNSLCINPKHLYDGTPKDNMLDKVQCGRQYKPEGVLHHAAKLTEKDVIEIRASNEKQKWLADKYDVSVSTISEIKSGKRWRHIL